MRVALCAPSTLPPPYTPTSQGPLEPHSSPGCTLWTPALHLQPLTPGALVFQVTNIKAEVAMQLQTPAPTQRPPPGCNSLPSTSSPPRPTITLASPIPNCLAHRPGPVLAGDYVRPRALLDLLKPPSGTALPTVTPLQATVSCPLLRPSPRPHWAQVTRLQTQTLTSSPSVPPAFTSHVAA